MTAPTGLAETRADDAALRVVADVFLVEPPAISGRSRHPHVMRSRIAAAWVLRRELGRTLEQVAFATGRSDHSAVPYLVRRAEELRASDARFKARTDAVVARITAQLAGEVAA